MKDGYCWCDMCGFNAKLPAKFRAEVEDSYACPWCKEAGGGFSLLCVGDELDELEEHVIPDDPMMTWPEIDPRAVWFARNTKKKSVKEQLLTISAAFNEVEAQRDSLLLTVGSLRRTLEDAESAFVVLYRKWLSAEKRYDMNEEMDALSKSFGRAWDRPEHPEGYIDNEDSGRMMKRLYYS